MGKNHFDSFITFSVKILTNETDENSGTKFKKTENSSTNKVFNPKNILRQKIFDVKTNEEF
jgi:hypothetical protein